MPIPLWGHKEKMMEATERLSDSVVVQGGLVVTHTRFNNVSGEVIVRGTVVYCGTEFRDIPILTIRSYKTMNKLEFQEIWFTVRIPRLDAIADFRKVILVALRDFYLTLKTKGYDRVLQEGVHVSIERLMTFSNGKSLVRSLRHIANGLGENNLHDWALAREALYALRVVPAVDVKLIVED